MLADTLPNDIVSIVLARDGCKYIVRCEIQSYQGRDYEINCFLWCDTLYNEAAARSPMDSGDDGEQSFPPFLSAALFLFITVWSTLTSPRC
jgi:hypothetical protein